MTARDDLLRAVQEYEALMTHSAGLNAEVPYHRKEAIQVRRRCGRYAPMLARHGVTGTY